MGKGPSDDYYALLGIDAGADIAMVRRAWRRLALRWHPDRAGPDAKPMFQRIAAAYAVLCDPLERAAYDRRRGPTARSSRTPSSDPAGAPAATPRQRASNAAGDAATAPAATNRRRAGDPAAAPAATPRRRAPGILLTRLSRSLDILLASGIARRAEGNIIELFLDAEEAAQGGMVTISMRVPVRCPACVRDETGACVRCGSRGTVDDLFSAWLAVPPGVTDSTVLTPSAQLRGMIRPVSFRVRVPA